MADGGPVSRRRVAPALPVLVALLLAGCGLPVESGVRAADPVAPESVERGDIQVLPPGPRADAGAREIVLGFLGAQASPDDRHALAREFLAPEVREEWDDTGSVLVYDPATLEVAPDPTDASLVVVEADTVATIESDGGYLLDDGAHEDVYRLAPPDAEGQLRLVGVPSGLRLTPAGASRSLRPSEVFFLAPAVDAAPTERLVPDRVFLPVTDTAGALVQRLLEGPSSALRGAVDTAVPADTTLRRPVTVSDGVVTVDLAGPVGALAPAARRQLSAQLVWTLQTALPAVPSLRLLVDGRPFEVPGVDAVQDRDDWPTFDPVGVTAGTAVQYVEERRLRRLGSTPTRSDVTDGRLPVDAVVTSPASGRLGVLTEAAETGAVDVVRVGPPTGPFEQVLALPAVRSLSWGSGGRGLWVLAGAADSAADSRVLLVPDAPAGSPVEVPYVPPGRAGPLTTLRISRDGARAAAVFGEGTDSRLYVGRIEPGDGVPRLAGLRPVAPGLSDVADVAWESGTSLVVLAPLGTPNRLPVRVAVDGSEVEPVRTLGLDGEPETVAAAPDRPLVVGAVLAGRPVLLVEDGGLFRLQAGTGRAPAYPG